MVFEDGLMRRTRFLAPGRGGFRPFADAFSTLRTDSSRRRSKQFRNADEIVGGSGEDEDPLDQPPTAVSRTAQGGHCLHPAEGLFNALAFDLADGIAGVTGRPCINRRAAVGVVLRDMWRAASFAAAGDEVRRVVVFVAGNGAAAQKEPTGIRGQNNNHNGRNTT